MTTQATHATQAVGVDIGGTGIKGALVDLEAGTLLSERVKVATPTGAEPDDVLTAVQTVLDTLGVTDADIPLGGKYWDIYCVESYSPTGTAPRGGTITLTPILCFLQG